MQVVQLIGHHDGGVILPSEIAHARIMVSRLVPCMRRACGKVYTFHDGAPVMVCDASSLSRRRRIFRSRAAVVVRVRLQL